jgi:hypothetical protein
MSEKKFSRIKGSTDERKFGEAPALGKVLRSPVSAVPRKGPRRVRGKRRKKLSKTVIAWTILLSLVALAAMLFPIVTFFRERAMIQGAAPSSANQEQALADAKRVKMPELDPAQAQDLVESALSNRDPDLVPTYFRLGDISDSEEALAALEAAVERDGPVSGKQWLGQRFSNGQTIGEVVVFMDNDGRQVNRLAQLTFDPSGSWRIDLDSYLRHTSPDWETIVSGKSDTSIVRVFLATDTYYNGIYSNESKWKAFALASPDVEEILYGYAERGSPQDRALTQILASEEKFHRATLQIKMHPGSGSRQFRVSRVVADNWVIGEQDFDELF